MTRLILKVAAMGFVLALVAVLVAPNTAQAQTFHHGSSIGGMHGMNPHGMSIHPPVVIQPYYGHPPVVVRPQVYRPPVYSPHAYNPHVYNPHTYGYRSHRSQTTMYGSQGSFSIYRSPSGSISWGFGLGNSSGCRH